MNIGPAGGADGAAELYADRCLIGAILGQRALTQHAFQHFARRLGGYQAVDDDALGAIGAMVQDQDDRPGEAGVGMEGAATSSQPGCRVNAIGPPATVKTRTMANNSFPMRRAFILPAYHDTCAPPPIL